jgi:uroporphyrinogen III methyltransferase/synthase
MGWIQQRPLLGQTVLVTRPADQAETLAGPLRELGANVLLQPAIEIGPPDDWTDVDQTINNLDSFDLIVFCSHNGVKYFMDRLLGSGGDARRLAGLRIATVGSKTAASLERYGLTADFVPADFQAASLADELRDRAQGTRILVVRASRGRDTLSESLTKAGATVTQIVAYKNCDVQQADPQIIDLARDGKIDWITVTSSASAASLVDLFGDSMQRMKIASLSPVTSKTLTDLGCEVSVEADPYTIDSLVEAISSERHDP